MYREPVPLEQAVQRCPNCQNDLNVEEAEWKVCTNCGHRWETKEENLISFLMIPVLGLWTLLAESLDWVRGRVNKRGGNK